MSSYRTPPSATGTTHHTVYIGAASPTDFGPARWLNGTARSVDFFAATPVEAATWIRQHPGPVRLLVDLAALHEADVQFFAALQRHRPDARVELFNTSDYPRLTSLLQGFLASPARPPTPAAPPAPPVVTATPAEPLVPPRRQFPVAEPLLTAEELAMLMADDVPERGQS